MTLLVVSLEVPRTFHELASGDAGLSSCSAVCFTVLILVWREHYTFFRRYGLQDNGTIWLNAALLFVTLFYVYPLKFLFNVFFSGVTGAPREVPGPDGRPEAVIEHAQIPTLFLIYGGGIIALYLCSRFSTFTPTGEREESRSSLALEISDTRASVVAHLLAAAVGALSCLVAVTAPVRMAGLAGFCYFLFAPVMAAHGVLAGRAGERARGRRRVNRFLWICLGGAAGTGARYLLSGWALSAFGAGVSVGDARGQRHRLVPRRPDAGRRATPLLSPTLRLALTTGVMGGFTTYSTFN